MTTLQHAVHDSALVVEGGAMRSIFSAGLLDGFLERQFNPFDFYIGVSAGASNLVTYITGASQKSRHIYQQLALRKEFISYSRFFRGAHLLDMDWLVRMAFAEIDDELKAAYGQAKPLYVCVTDVVTGKAVYINPSLDALPGVIKASTALPLFYRGFPRVAGRPMTDGGVAQGIPVAEAIRRGAKRIMVIRSRHKHYMKKDTLGHRYIRWKMKSYPALQATMRQRISIHRQSVALIRHPPPGVKIVEICPAQSDAISRFNRNRKSLQQAYQLGLSAADDAIRQWLSLRA
jgi:predicted patatin/cPLA2 family phospholipase